MFSQHLKDVENVENKFLHTLLARDYNMRAIIMIICILLIVLLTEMSALVEYNVLHPLVGPDQEYTHYFAPKVINFVQKIYGVH